MITTLENPKKSAQVAAADDPRWARIAARDRSADGQFWYSVMTTGVYCRPSCPSRTANPQNVQLHDTLEAAKATGMLGMPPTQYRAGGANEDIRFAVGQCSLGAILVASSRKGVASILLGNDPGELVRILQDRFPKANLIGADSLYEAFVARVVGLIEAPSHGLDLPLDVRGTAFQQRVWQAPPEGSAGPNASPPARP